MNSTPPISRPPHTPPDEFPFQQGPHTTPQASTPFPGATPPVNGPVDLPPFEMVMPAPSPVGGFPPPGNSFPAPGNSFPAPATSFPPFDPSFVPNPASEVLPAIEVPPVPPLGGPVSGVGVPGVPMSEFGGAAAGGVAVGLAGAGDPLAAPSLGVAPGVPFVGAPEPLPSAFDGIEGLPPQQTPAASVPIQSPSGLPSSADIAQLAAVLIATQNDLVTHMQTLVDEIRDLRGANQQLQETVQAVREEWKTAPQRVVLEVRYSDNTPPDGKPRTRTKSVGGSIPAYAPSAPAAPEDNVDSELKTDEVPPVAPGAQVSAPTSDNAPDQDTADLRSRIGGMKSHITRNKNAIAKLREAWTAATGAGDQEEATKLLAQIQELQNKIEQIEANLAEASVKLPADA